MKQTRIDYWYTDIRLDVAESALRRALGQYARHHRWFYIGLTQQQPEARFQQHQRKWAEGHEWDRMVVIYRARTLASMQQAEDRLIAYARSQIQQQRYQCVLINARDSQPPRIASTPDGYWVYVLLQA